MTETIIDERTYCAVHPDRETGLRCNKCGRLMCVDCAVQTPVGYRCRECVRGIQQKFYNATQADYLQVFIVCALITGVAAGIAGAIRIPILFLLLLGLPIGGAIAELTVRIVQKRRGARLDMTAMAGAVVGGLVGMIAPIVIQYNQFADAAAASGLQAPPLSLDLIVRQLAGDFSALIFVGLVAAAIYGRYKMRS
ncbi:MAG: B-box zinc finger protein [Chloroflexota bacterium]|nr:B-box zinc finger protein [Chloroflexota bacterium]